MRYTVGVFFFGCFFFFSKTIQYSFFTAHGPPYYQERMAISVYSLNVMKYMENRIKQWITLHYMTRELTLSDLFSKYWKKIIL